MRASIVIDSEIGNNIDDAFSIALAAVSPEVELLGVTTTYYESDRRAALARRLLDSFGRAGVPTACGNDGRWSGPNRTPSSFTQKNLCGAVSPSDYEDAGAWLSNLLEKFGNITYVANAPLTNLASLICGRPDLAGRISRIVFMGGWSSQALHEWNVMQDPDAVQVVLNSGIPIVFIGLEVTLGCILSEEYLAELRGADGLGVSFLMSLYDCYVQHSGLRLPIVHDPLTVAYIIDPSLLELTDDRVQVDLRSGAGYGILQRGTASGSIVQIATSVDRRKYLEMLVGRLRGMGGGGSPSDRSVMYGLLDALEVSYYPGWSHSESAPYQHTFAYVSRGSCLVEDDGDGYLAEQGDLLYLKPKKAYKLTTMNGMTMWLAHFKVSAASSAGAAYLTDAVICANTPVISKAKGAETIMQRLVTAWQAPTARGALKCQSLLYELLSELVDDRNNSSNSSAALEIVKKAKLFLETHAEDDLTLDDLCGVVGASKQTVIRLFRLYEDTTPMSYHHYLRIRRAKALLELGHLSVKEISLRLGFSSVQVFSRSFKGLAGICPAGYQRQYSRRLYGPHLSGDDRGLNGPASGIHR